MTTLETVIFKIDEWPCQALYRMALGFAIPWICVKLLSQDPAGSGMVAGFVAGLILIRAVPLVLRRVLPFSGELEGLWFQRRMLSKTYDSYQWRKMFWMGVGMTLFGIGFGSFLGAIRWLSVFCLLTGIVGIWMWNRVARPIPNAV